MHKKCSRKNADLAYEFIGTQATKGNRKFTLDQAVQHFKERGLVRKWNLDPKALDEHGFKRALGDLFGGHGLQLETKMLGDIKWYLVPDDYVDEYMAAMTTESMCLWEVQLEPFVGEFPAPSGRQTLNVVAGYDGQAAIDAARAYLLDSSDVVDVQIISVSIINQVALIAPALIGPT